MLVMGAWGVGRSKRSGSESEVQFGGEEDGMVM